MPGAGVAPRGRRDRGMPAPLISVVIPHLNQHSGLERCLTALRGQTLPPHEFEVIVVDNGSTLLPSELRERYGARLPARPAPGPGPARQRGVGLAPGPTLAL